MNTLAYVLTVTVPILTLKLIVLFALALQGCGDDSSSGGASDTPATEVASEGQESPSKRQSISLATFADLPACDELLKNQLAYVRDSETFYVCDGDWIEITIKGRDGVDGITQVTTTEVEGTNKKNQWVDPLTGKTWIIGGSALYSQTATACTNGYRIPTYAEAELAIAHGIRGIAASIPALQDFWISTNQTYITVTSGVQHSQSVAANVGAAVYCVK